MHLFYNGVSFSSNANQQQSRDRAIWTFSPFASYWMDWVHRQSRFHWISFEINILHDVEEKACCITWFVCRQDRPMNGNFTTILTDFYFSTNIVNLGLQIWQISPNDALWYLQRYTQIHISEQQIMCCWKQHPTWMCEIQKIGPSSIF